MTLKLYNTLTRKKEIFKPIKRNSVKIYSCGPTVYWYQHIGNLRSYLAWDFLKRVLIFNKYKVKHIINITDVGHLTSDSDEGEDKIEKAAKKEGKTAKEITSHYFNAFKKDFEKLNILEPNFWPKATEHIKEQIELIKILEKKGFTYKTSDGLYFNSCKLEDYGKLGRTNIQGIFSGKRIEIGEKKHKTDFALWKFSINPGLRQQEWNSPWGLGFPGWHIECSAMSSKYLGKQFDIHTGGQEHINVHHTNEIAQSEAAFGKKPWVNYWLHSAWLLFKGEKISKSTGGLFTVSELESQGFNPLYFRYLCLTTHYRKPLDFNLGKLSVARISYEKLNEITKNIRDDKRINKKYLLEFEKSVNDDLNIPRALQVLWKLVRDKKANGKFKTIKKMDEDFGLNILEKNIPKIPKNILDLVKEREKSRKEKNWKISDDIRNKIKLEGYSLEDSEKGTIIKKEKSYKV